MNNKFLVVACTLFGAVLGITSLLFLQQTQYTRACVTALLGEEPGAKKVKLEMLLKGVDNESFVQLESWKDDIEEGFTLSTLGFSLGVDNCKED